MTNCKIQLVPHDAVELNGSTQLPLSTDLGKQHSTIMTIP